MLNLNHKTIQMEHTDKNNNMKGQYTTFVSMLDFSFVAMYMTMYLNTYQFVHVYFSLTRFYMACLGI